MHTPVLFEEVMDALDVRPSQTYIDATLGEGGFSRAIRKKGGRLLSLDWDEEQVKRAQQELGTDDNIAFATANFADIASVAMEHGFESVDGVIFDLGLSMRQLAESGRGFSYKNHSEPLDMRINRGTTPVSEYINSYKFDELYEIISRYSEELNSRAIVQSLVRARAVKPIATVGDLIKGIDTVLDSQNVPPGPEREKTYARVFQSLRIAANEEFENIRKGIEGAMKLLHPEGRIVVITFHSLEDRVVKKVARSHNLAMKVIKPRYEKVKPFERSAKVRILRLPTV